jgi:hypothetical protein
MATAINNWPACARARSRVRVATTATCWLRPQAAASSITNTGGAAQRAAARKTHSVAWTTHM